MKTQLLRSPALDSPQLEYFPSKGGGPERVEIDAFPFTIGRDETAMLRLDSNRVSREHAAIIQQSGVYRIRDLGSTNGTFLNGERTNEAPLNDGDVLLIADIEMTFLCGVAASGRSTATQLIGGSEHDGHLPHDSREIVDEVRRVNEQLTCRAVRTLFRPIVKLSTLETFGYAAVDDTAEGGEQSDGGALVPSIDCRLSERLRHAARLAAIDDAARFAAEAIVMLPIHPSELGCNSLSESLRRARRLLGDERKLVVQVPETAAGGTAYFQEFRRLLTELKIEVAYSRFAAGHAHLLEHQERPPDYLVLDPSLVLHLDRSQRRQSQIEGLIRVCREHQIIVIAGGIRSGKETETCRGLGIEYGQGDHFGHPQPAAVLASAEN